jgi:outer membrane protein assembly factor BamB
MYVLDIETGSPIKVFDNTEILSVSAIASQPVAFENYVFFANHDGIIYKIDTTTQTITQLAALTGTITSPLIVYEGNIYFQTQDIVIQSVNIENGAVASISLISG